MQWKYDAMVQEHQLHFNKEVQAKIQTTQLKRGGLKVVSMISRSYFSIKTQEKMERQSNKQHNKQWVAYRKKFAHKDDAQKYIARKKEEMLKFINSREKEG